MSKISIGKIIKNAKIKDKQFLEYIKKFYSHYQYKNFTNFSENLILDLAKKNFDFVRKNISRKETKISIENFPEENLCIIDIISKNKPFLIDSLVIKIEEIGIKIENIIHPLVTVDSGQIIEDLSQYNGDLKSVIQIQIPNLLTTDEISQLKNDLANLFDDIDIIFSQWQIMLDKIKESKNNFDSKFHEELEFINWLIEKNFIFLGCVVTKNGKIEDSQGILKKNQKKFAEEINLIDQQQSVLSIFKSKFKAEIHRSRSLDIIKIPRFNDQKNIIGNYIFFGVFPNSVFNKRTSSIPLIRQKTAKVIKEANLIEGNHNFKELLEVFETFPKTDLFQMEYKEILEISLGITLISGRSIVRYFSAIDATKRFINSFIFVPKDYFNSAIRKNIKIILEQEYGGEVLEFYVHTVNSNLVRVNMIVSIEGKELEKISDSQIEKKLIMICQSWQGKLKELILNKFTTNEDRKKYLKYIDIFSISYTNRFTIAEAIDDIDQIEKLKENKNVICRLKESSQVDGDVCEIKLYSFDNITLSSIMPILNGFGLNVIFEHTYRCATEDDISWISYFSINLDKAKINQKIVDNFEQTVQNIFNHKALSGQLNRLIIAIGLDFRQVSLLRAYLRYLHQAGFSYSQQYISDILVKNSQLAKMLIKLFENKFDPKLENNRIANIKKIINDIKEYSKNISDISEENVIQRFFNIINATVRTNFYQTTVFGDNKDYISFKFNSSEIIDLPAPTPYREIFVFSNDVEAIHLRGGKVSRGGLRWSDRHEDFRVEVLGLMKAQMTKNSVIVPEGSKGGFVIKKDLSGLDRSEMINATISCYKTFLRGMLDITDNIEDGCIIHPKDTVIHDDEDPYLVVAADKGTATFSDIANSISKEYNFWLGDAFASGGSNGYDHKKMGITAKGAWVSVWRHFLEINLNVQKEEFTCVGIGDMSGDVFGNGLLRSKHTKLVAAFNHMHIFIDPNPNPEISFNERKRLFGLSRSTWEDYNPKLISKGGGVFLRNQKTIKISKEIQNLLDIKNNELSTVELIKAILKSPVDLIWNGGIGTYVKASDEANYEVGDKVNDSLRVNGEDLRCKVFGEGGNLGLTQKGRIEYALNGGKINTDSIDNSAGVDCSDHEVNIKIVLKDLVKKQKISETQRNEILASMTDEIGKLVLQNNKMQTKTISISQSKSFADMGNYTRFLKNIEDKGLLKRKIEFLPEDKDITKRQSEGLGMSRPELAVMLSYSKIDLYKSLINSDLISDPYFKNILLRYFPSIMQEKFSEEIYNHQLAKEIITTEITNFIINRSGITFISEIAEDSGVSLDQIVKSYIVACEIFNLKDTWHQIDALDGKIDYKTQIKMSIALSKLLERSVIWLARKDQDESISKIISKYKDQVRYMSSILSDLLTGASKESYDYKIKKYSDYKVPKSLAKTISAISPLAASLDIIYISQKFKVNLEEVGQIYFKVGSRLALKFIRNNIYEYQSKDYWEKISMKTILESIYSYQGLITDQIFELNQKSKQQGCLFENWINSKKSAINSYNKFIDDIKATNIEELAIFVALVNRTKALLN